MKKTTSDFPYVHGFSVDEQERLRQQARFTEHSIYHDLDFTGCEHLLEVGCGVGAQTEILLRRFPHLKITGIDKSKKQLQAARAHLKSLPWTAGRTKLEEEDATQMGFKAKSFDGAFLCWVLEHMSDPSKVLSEVRRVLKPGGMIVVNEVMNSSFFLDPYSPATWQYWMAFNDYQNDIGGDPFIGMKLGNLLLSQGFSSIQTKAKTWHYDNRTPDKRKEFIDFWSSLLLSAADQLIKTNYVSQEVVTKMKDELKLVANDPNAVFHFTFMQAYARVY